MDRKTRNAIARSLLIAAEALEQRALKKAPLVAEADCEEEAEAADELEVEDEAAEEDEEPEV